MDSPFVETPCNTSNPKQKTCSRLEHRNENFRLELLFVSLRHMTVHDSNFPVTKTLQI